MIYFDKDIGDYYHQNFDKMYHDLRECKRDVYHSDDVVLVKSYTHTDFGLWKHFFRIVKFLDIPTFFIHIQTNNSDLAETVLPVFEDIFPGEDLHIKTVPLRKYNTSDTLCIHPFSSIYVTGKGKYKICCSWNEDLGDMTIENTSIAQAQASEKFQTTRQQMLSGKRPEACNTCWLHESVGNNSMRTSTDQIFPELTYGIDYTNQSQDIHTLDLHLGNVCNLKCRICGPSSSSAWVKETGEDSVFQPSWIDDQNSMLWQHLKMNLDTLKYITFHGGEPFLDRKHYAIIDYLIEQNRTDIKLHYNTNGTVYPNVLLNKLQQFNSVTLSFSIDNVGERFEYERHGKSWDFVYKNLVKFSKLDKSRFILEFNSTVSVFNILDLDSVVDLCDELGYNPHFQILQSPSYYSILTIPKDKRHPIIEQLSSSKNLEVRSFAKYLKDNPYNNKVEEFWLRTSDRDIIRNENFKRTYHEITEVLNG